MEWCEKISSDLNCIARMPGYDSIICPESKAYANPGLKPNILAAGASCGHITSWVQACRAADAVLDAATAVASGAFWTFLSGRISNLPLKYAPSSIAIRRV